MATQKRFKTIVPIITGLYVAEDTSERAVILRDGLLAVAECSVDDWATVRKDSARLLSVWAAKEDDTAAPAVVTQILNVLSEFIEFPTLVITESEQVIQHLPAPVPSPVPSPSPSPFPQFHKSTVLDTESVSSIDMDVDDVVDEDDEDDDSGIEVEKRIVRGRTYWHDAKTNKLYAVIGDDDVGDEVGVLLANGNPVLLA